MALPTGNVLGEHDNEAKEESGKRVEREPLAEREMSKKFLQEPEATHTKERKSSMI